MGNNIRVTMGEESPSEEVERPSVVDEAWEEPGSEVETETEELPDEVAEYLGDDDDPESLEDLDPSEEMWPNGPTVGEVLAWKQEYGDVYVTSITLDTHILWRTMTRAEYRAHSKRMTEIGQSGADEVEIKMLNEELITEMCTLFPKLDLKNMAGNMAGIPSIIAQEVLEASGFVALEVRQL